MTAHHPFRPPPGRAPVAALLLGLALPGCLGGVYDYADGITCLVHDDCPSGFVCDPDGAVCIDLERRHLCEHDGHCWSNEVCADGQCQAGFRGHCDPNACADLSPEARCTIIDDQPRCQPVQCINDFNCGPGQTCANGQCVGGERITSARSAGDHCAEDAECANQTCAGFDATPEHRFCTSFECVGEPYMACGPKSVCFEGIGCMPRGMKDFGEPCTGGQECRGGLCLEGTCSSFCTSVGGCPRNLTCVGIEGLSYGGCYDV